MVVAPPGAVDGVQLVGRVGVLHVVAIAEVEHALET